LKQLRHQLRFFVEVAVAEQGFRQELELELELDLEQRLVVVVGQRQVQVQESFWCKLGLLYTVAPQL